MEPAVREHHTDVDALVVGGGIAGCFAALELRARGRSVVVVDKSPIRRSGNAGLGIDHWATSSPLVGAEADRPEVFTEMAAAAVESVLDGRGDINDIANFGADMFTESFQRLLELEEMGIKVRDGDGKFRVVKGAGFGAVWIEGGDIKPKLSEAVTRAGAQRREHVMVTDLLSTPDGRVTGAVGFNVRTGAFHVFAARTVLVATGWTARLFDPFQTEGGSSRPFDNVYCPLDTGDGQMAAYRAGAELTNMEFLALTVTPRDHATAGISGFLSAGCRIRNAHGEAFMERYEPAADSAPRQRLVRACIEEIQEGRGPLFVDTATMTAAEVHELRTAWANEVPLVPRYMELKGVVPGRDRTEIVPTVALASGRIRCETSGAASVPGLFAAGDCADVLPGCADAAASVGRRAGRAMHEHMEAQDASGRDRPEAPGPDSIAAARAEVYAPARLEAGPRALHWQDVAGELRHVMGAYVGVTRSSSGLALGRARLERLWEAARSMRAADWHELMRVHETRNLVRFGRLMAAASEQRTESRFGNAHWHHRSDHPATSAEEFDFVVLSKGGTAEDPPRIERREPAPPVATRLALLESMRPRRGAVSGATPVLDARDAPGRVDAGGPRRSRTAT